VTRRALALVGLIGTTLVAIVASPATARPAGPPPDRRVVVFAVPGLTWNDVDSGALPTFRALLDESAVANVATRVTRVVAQPGEAYLTLGTGTRAVAPAELAGQVFDAEEAFGAGTAADEHARQRGQDPAADVVALSWTLLEAENVASEFDGAIGGLGQALEDAGVHRGVVANADGADPLLPGEPIHREAALALADVTGALECGEVGPGLLASDEAAPFGVRLDQERILAAVARCSIPGSVVLVEASDLRRATAFGPRATGPRAAAARASALASTDELLAGLLDQLDPERDAIMVVAPSTAPDPGLGVVGIRAAEHPPGLLVSGSTRRAGYVLLADLTPSIARLAGVVLDEASIEGRAMESRTSSLAGAALRDELLTGESAALFRDRMLTPVVVTMISVVSALALALAVALLRGWTWLLPWLERFALSLLAFPSLTYLAALFPFYDWGAGAYWAFLVAGSMVVGLLASTFRREWLHPLAFTYGLIAGVVTLSVVAFGSRLQVATVFGDSPIVAGRFTGINNVTFAFFILAGSMLACIVVDRVPGARGQRLMLVLLGAVLLIDVAPMWGADVGGALAGLPALGLVAAGLGRWKVRWRTVALVGVATIALVVALGLLDLTRASADRSHLGRLFERIGNDGAGGLTTVVERKLTVNLRSLTDSAWRFIFGPLAIAAALVAWRARDRARAVVLAFPALRWALPGLIALAVLGYGANDSGIAVPAAMLASFVPGLVYLACRVDDEAVS
jgi:hypothetical protein